MKDFADQLLMESRNDVNHKNSYTHKCRCWGKCFDEYKKQATGISDCKFKQLYGEKELEEVSTEYYKTKKGQFRRRVIKVYYGPIRDFFVTETGIWTSITCPECGYSNFWAVGDGNELF